MQRVLTQNGNDDSGLSQPGERKKFVSFAAPDTIKTTWRPRQTGKNWKQQKRTKEKLERKTAVAAFTKCKENTTNSLVLNIQIAISLQSRQTSNITWACDDAFELHGVRARVAADFIIVMCTTVASIVPLKADTRAWFNICAKTIQWEWLSDIIHICRPS